MSGIHFDRKAALNELKNATFKRFLFQEIVIRLAQINSINPDAFGDNADYTRTVAINNCGLTSHQHYHHQNGDLNHHKHSEDDQHEHEDHVETGSISIYEPLTIFSKFTQLEELDLSSNSLTFIPDSVFSARNNKLRVIKLSFNKIHTIGSNAFSGLSRLRILKLNTNHIHRIGANALFPIIHDEILKARENIERTFPNQISVIAGNVAITMNEYIRERMIIRINLFDNHLTPKSFSNETFSLIKTPIHIKMNFNYITDIDENIYKPVLINQGTIELHNNKINCDPCTSVSNWIIGQDARKTFCAKCTCSNGVNLYDQAITNCELSNRR